eukprot:362989-Chlamydomonas_euryale.AAC.6
MSCMHEAVQVNIESSHRPLGCPHRMRTCPRWADGDKREDSVVKRQPLGQVSTVLSLHVPAGYISCVESRHARHTPHMHVDNGSGPAKQAQVLPHNGDHSAEESLNHVLGNNAFPKGMRAPAVRQMCVFLSASPTHRGMFLVPPALGMSIATNGNHNGCHIHDSRCGTASHR